MHRFLFAALAVLFVALAPVPGNAASSKWVDLGGGKARLVALIHPEDGRIEGFVEFALEDGWKTYWKYPGDSGIAPVFDFSASSGLQIGSVAYPAPKFIQIPGSSFAGYKGDTRFVFEGVLEGNSPALSLNLMAGVCKDICIPATASFTIDTSSLETSDVRAMLDLEAAREHLPEPSTGEFKVTAAKLSDDGMLTFEVNAPQDMAEAHLFVMPPAGLFPTEPQAETPMENGTLVFRSSIGPDFVRDQAVSEKWEYVLTAGGKAVTGKIEIGE